MQRLIKYGDEFVKQSDWRDIALIELCLSAAGIMWGLALPKKAHKPSVFVVVSVFVMTYIPLMLKLIRIIDNDTSEKMI